jgi:hypothetical protein
MGQIFLLLIKISLAYLVILHEENEGGQGAGRKAGGKEGRKEGMSQSIKSMKEENR